MDSLEVDAAACGFPHELNVHTSHHNSSFWELLSLLGQRYEADIKLLSRSSPVAAENPPRPCEGPPALLSDMMPSSTSKASSASVRSHGSPRNAKAAAVPVQSRTGSKDIESSVVVDERVARNQWRTLQHLLSTRQEPMASHQLDNEGDSEESDHLVFEPRTCWQDGDPTPPGQFSRRKSLASLGSRVSATRTPVGSLDVSQGGCFMLSPYRPARRAWDVLVIVCILFELTVSPLSAFFDIWGDARPLSALGRRPAELALLIFWVLDLLVTLRTAILSNGHLDYRQLEILKRYASGWLAFDVTYIALGLAAVITQDPSCWLVQVLLRLVRMLRLNKVLGSIEGQLLSDLLVAKFNICVVSIQILLIQHAMSCAWYYVGTLNPENGWVAAYGLAERPPFHRYVTSLYWMFCEIGFGVTEIHPTTTLETEFGIAVAVVGLAIFSLLLGTITTNISLLSKSSEDHRHEFRRVRMFLAHYHVDRGLRTRIIHFLEGAYALNQRGRPGAGAPLLTLLSKPLQHELQFARHEASLKELGFCEHLLHATGFVASELDMLQHFATYAVSQITMAAGDSVFEAGTVAHSAYFIDSTGQIFYRTGQSDAEMVTGPRWLSEMTLWTPWLHLGELTTKEVSSIVSLRQKDFLECLRRSFDWFQLAQTYARDYLKVMSQYAAVTDLWVWQVEPDPGNFLRNGSRSRTTRKSGTLVQSSATMARKLMGHVFAANAGEDFAQVVPHDT